jgi:hypothetical protein
LGGLHVILTETAPIQRITILSAKFADDLSRACATGKVGA